MNKAYLLLGGNIGDRLSFLQNALVSIEKLIGRVVKKSSVYETEAWGVEHVQPFLNQLLLVETILSPEELLDAVLKTELLLGRERKGEKWVARTLDIDILFFNDIIVEKENLHIPHPYLYARRFALVLLHEIEPDLVHPVLKKNISRLLSECPDNLKVVKLSTQPQPC